MLAPDPDGRWVAAFLINYVVPIVAVIALGIGLLTVFGQVIRDRVNFGRLQNHSVNLAAVPAAVQYNAWGNLA